MKGYLNNPEATAASIDPEGWYHTGDVGYVDEEGWFYIVDRTKELIKYKGMQVAPAELEALLLTHPAVLDVAVVRRPDEEAGEIPKAFVVVKPDPQSRATTGESIMTWVADHVSPHKRVRLLEFVDQIPKSPSGKILRRLLTDGAGEISRREFLSVPVGQQQVTLRFPRRGGFDAQSSPLRRRLHDCDGFSRPELGTGPGAGENRRYQPAHGALWRLGQLDQSQ